MVEEACGMSSVQIMCSPSLSVADETVVRPKVADSTAAAVLRLRQSTCRSCERYR